jgi:hypothetical protein
MNAHPKRACVPDPSVLMDYREACPSGLKLFSLNVTPIYGVRQALSLAQIGAEDCAALSIRIIDPDTSTLLEAAQLSPSLGFEESLCCLVCRASHYTCVTNDCALEHYCAAAGIAVIGGLDLLGCLVRLGSLPATKASAAAHAMHTSNPSHIPSDALRAFDKRLSL